MPRMARFLPLSLLLVLGSLPEHGLQAAPLSDDGRAATVLAVQGTALVQPAGRARWTPLGPKSVLFAGDVIRTPSRGAHALEWRSSKGTFLLGPGGRIQLNKDGPHLVQGELAVTAPEGKVATVRSAGEMHAASNGHMYLRGGTAGLLKTTPRWVEGYRSSSSNEWMGSLLAKVDGRDVPLAVGYHKVDAEIRDQIARTTIEQSFINSTSRRLEGVFYFPLPADASISGFAMWIGGELVEADIVERQRARQIYEDILRRKKDPGLLEWEGGNLFKARVFPIEAHSEKRIRIRYTQVLPLEGSTMRYRYALRSELLRSKPLRELQLTVRVVSETPIEEVSSPTHETLKSSTANEATVQFSASEYRPDKDFEVAVKLARGAELTAIPHRRGDDGYFMMLLAPPDEEAGRWKRDLVPDGKPLHLVILADTSGSMDAAARSAQEQFIAGLAGVLGEQDRISLLACDVRATALTTEPTPPADLERALEQLAATRSLGWTDIDRALSKALGMATDGSVLVYIGDGVGTTGDADPVALAERIDALGKNAKVTMHAVAVSSSYEAPVLEALARIGGGSVRTVGDRPVKDAFALLAEAARPALRDIRISVEGIRTARVYPQRPPNLPMGQQQIVLGRYLPTGEAQTGRVVVTGTRAGKPVRFTAELTVPAGDAGNSFLPRLWGRRHIDALLAQGASKQNQEEIVAFSERFGIMTPYTSFLVLESDEDRERYGVERRVRMRDGERFFAEARDRATLEKQRALMKAAGRWRQQLRRKTLLEIARLGRDLPIETPPRFADMNADGSVAFGLVDEAREVFRSQIGIGGGAGGAFRGRGGARSAPAVGSELRALESASSWDARIPADPMAMPASPAAAPAPSAAMPARRASKSKAAADAEPADELDGLEESLEDMAEAIDFEEDKSGGFGFSSYGRRGQSSRVTAGLGWSDAAMRYRGYRWRPPAFHLGTLGFPTLPPPPAPLEGEPGEPWNEEVTALLRSLIRRDHVRSVKGGLQFVIRNENLHGTRGTVIGASTIQGWIGNTEWRLRSETGGAGEPREHWLHDGTVGALAVARRLARTRDAEDEDANAWWLPIWDLQTRDVIRTWKQQGYRARIAKREDGRVLVVLEMRKPDRRRTELLIDTEKQALLSQSHYDGHAALSNRTVYTNHVEVAGRWWAQTIERWNRNQQRVGRTAVLVSPLAAGALEGEAARATAEQADVITIHGTLPKVPAAKQTRHEKRATFVDHLVVALRHGHRQQWKTALAAWDAAQGLVNDKPGRRWIRMEFLARNRQGEAFKGYLRDLIGHVGTEPGAATRFLAQLVWARSGILGANERSALLDDLKARWIDASSPAADGRRESWMLTRAAMYTSAGKPRQALAIAKEAAEAFPHSFRAQRHYTNGLWSTARPEAAIEHARMLLADREPWMESERHGIYDLLANLLWDRRRIEELEQTLAAWIEHESRDRTTWKRWFSIPYFRGNDKAGDETLLAALQKRIDDDAPEPAWVRLGAAADIALGNGWNFHAQRIEEMFHQPLADLVRHLWRNVERSDTPVYRILSDWRFGRTDGGRNIRQSMRADVLAEGAIESMPVVRLKRYIEWIGWGPKQVQDEPWQQTLDRVRARWNAAKDKDERGTLGNLVLKLLDARGRREEAIAFARVRLESAHETVRVARATDLYKRLLKTPVRDEHQTEAREDEVVALLPRLVNPKDAKEATRAGIARRARALAKQLYTWRYERALGTPKEREPLSRAALKTLRKEARQSTREWLTARMGKAESAADEHHKPWLRLERLAYGVEAGKDLESLVAEAAGVLQADWKREDIPLDRLIRERAAVVMAYAATRRNASDALQESVLATLRAGEEAEPEKDADDEPKDLLDWRRQIARLLIALDRAPALETALRAWIVPAKVESRWRKALGYLLAETGRLADAAGQFEEVDALGELAAGDYRVLADWYLVLDRDADREAVLDKRYDHMNEYGISSTIWALQRKMSSRAGGVPGDLDPEIFRALRALMRKATWPGNYWNRIRNVYRPTKDFRALESVTEGLIGHTKEGIYGFLARLTRLLREVHEEATLDALREWLDTVRGETDSALERRALLLATALVEGRAADVPEADVDHGKRALAALKQAFQEAWQPGERWLMASHLHNLGAVKDEATRDEQLRQLAALHRDTKDEQTRLRIAHVQAKTHWAYKQKERALAILHAAVAETRAANEGRVPMDSRNVFDTYANWLSEMGRFRDAEREIQAEIEKADLHVRRQGLTRFLFQHYVKAVWAGGSTSLGRGTALFTAVRDRIEANMAESPATLGEVLPAYLDLHKHAQKRGAPGDAARQLDRFGRERFPALLARVPLAAASHVDATARMLRELLGRREAIAFVLDRNDAEPRWLERINRTIWNDCNRELAQWRHEAGSIGDLEPRLFALVDGRLARHLASGDYTGSHFWSRGNKWFWAARASEFAATAERIAELRIESPTTVMRCAKMLYSRLGFGGRGIALLQAAHGRGQLDLGGRWTLAQWLYSTRRLKDCLPMLEALIAERPDTLTYRTHLVKALADLKRKTESREALDAIEARWRERKRWTENVAARVARLAAEQRWAERSVRWIEEAIRLRQEARGHRGGVDRSLASYYQTLALGRAQLGQTQEAVRAAASGILMTGTRHRGRYQEAVQVLDRVLRDTSTLDAYAASYETEVEKSGLDAPILRKALARAYERRANQEAALRHLLIARELEPGDADTHKRLVALYDRLGAADKARDALLTSIRLAPRNYDAYVELAERYYKARDDNQAERALTTLAEMAPNQPDGHRRLAEFRGKEERWKEAVVQWRQVVRTDRLNPTGWIALAKALLEIEQTDDARKALDHVLKTDWEPRFKKAKTEAATLRAKLP